MKKILAASAVIIVLVVLALSRFGPSFKESSVDYYSPVWSPDGQSVAYYKRSMAYSYTEPVLKLPYLTPEKTYNFSKDTFELIIRTVATNEEKTIKSFKLSLTKTDPETPFGTIDPKIGWYQKGYLQYAVVTSGFQDDIDTGNNMISPEGKGDTYISPSFDARTKIINSFPINKSDKELFPVGPTKTVFIFDHKAKKVRFFFGDKGLPLPKYRPYTEPINQ